MSHGDKKLSKLGIALIIIFAISLLSLVVQLFLTLWRRHILRRQINAGFHDGKECVDHHPSIYSPPDPNLSSKEIVNFVRLKSPARLRPDSKAASSNRNMPKLGRKRDMDVLDIDLLMLQGRFLFTIKEDERGECGSPEDDKSRFSANRAANRIGEVKRNGWVDFTGRLKAVEDTGVELETVEGRHDDTTPFSTASSSPIYYTPQASPKFDVAGGRAK